MTEEEAMRITQRADKRPLTTADGKRLEKLEPYLPDAIFGDIWSAFLTSCDLPEIDDWQ